MGDADADVPATLRKRTLRAFDCIAALVPPPGTHRHRYFGVLAPNSPLRCAVTAITLGRARRPHISPARGPPLWDDCDAQTDEGVRIKPDWDLAAQPAPDFEVDQRVSW